MTKKQPADSPVLGADGRPARRLEPEPKPLLSRREWITVLSVTAGGIGTGAVIVVGDLAKTLLWGDGPCDPVTVAISRENGLPPLSNTLFPIRPAGIQVGVTIPGPAVRVVLPPSRDV